MLSSLSFRPWAQSFLKEVGVPPSAHPPRVSHTRLSSSPENIGAVESVKAASDIVSVSISVSISAQSQFLPQQYAPVSGKVLEINDELNSQPGLLNKSPEVDRARAEGAKEVGRLRSECSSEIALMRDQMEKEVMARKGQFEMELISTKASPGIARLDIHADQYFMIRPPIRRN